MTGKRARPRKIFPTWKINIPPPVPSWYVNRQKSSLDPQEPLWTSYEANDQTEELGVVRMVVCSRRAIHLVRRALSMLLRPRQDFSSLHPIAASLGTKIFAWPSTSSRPVILPRRWSSSGAITTASGANILYMSRAPHELRHAGAGELVAIPFFLSIADPVLQKVKASLPSYGRLGRSVGLRPWQTVT